MNRIELQPPDYQSYLLRLWRDHGGAPWRATLVAVARPDEQRHFVSLDALLAFLLAQTDPATVLAQAEASQSAEWDRDHCTPGGASWEDPAQGGTV
jgi:hypothetical protein